MTLGKHSESATAAYSKRKAQLERWQESETDKESVEIRNRPKRVKFADKCIFQAACASNDKAQVARMIKDGYNINAVDEDGITALHQACIEDNFDMVEFLLDNGADVNISDNEGWTPLHAVATCCYVSIAKLLLEHNANVVALNNDCSIPLDICKSDEIRELFKQAIAAKGIDLGEARKGEELKMIEDARRWLSTGVYEEQPHPITGATAMHVASCKGYIKVLDQLIKAGADLNGRDVDGWTPLHAAAHWGQEEACRVLLESGCDMSLKNNCDQNALDVADLCVVPVLEEFKKKHDVNKNLDPVIGKLNVLPLPPKKKNPRLVFDDSDVYSSNYLHPQKTTDFANCSSDQEEYDANEAEAEDTVGELPSSSESIIDSNPALAISSFSDYIIANDPASKAYTADERSNETQSNLDKGVNSGYSNASSRSIGDSVKGAKTSDLEKDSNTVPGQLTSTLAVPAGSSTGPRADGDAAGDDNTPAWRRGGSLRTKTPTSPLEDKDKASDRVTVRRTRSEASNDVNLRRAYSFESDSKFYSKLISARNRIKAIEAASAAMTANFLVNSHAQSLTDTTTTTTSTISPPVTTTSAISESTVLNPTDSIKGPMSNQTYNKASSNNNFEVVLRRKDTDSVRSAARPTTISTSSAQNRVAGGNGSVVQMRSGESGSTPSSPSPASPSTPGGTKIGPVSKFKQFLIKSFVPPARDEESETQRKAHAKRVRETRRSTQGVTLEELKSAEQYVKAQQNTHTTPNEPPSGSQPSAPVPGAGSASTVLRKDEESLERRPSWRLRVDDSDRSKFSLEDTRSTVSSRGPPPSSSRNLVEPDQERVQHSPTTRSRSSRLESSFHGRPPRPPEESVEDKVVPPVGDEKEKENKISGAQGAIAKKKRPKRRSTGVVSYNADESEEHDDQLSDTEGSARGSDVETGPESSRSENGVVTRVNYRKLYEETLKENQQLKSRLSTMEEQLADLKLKADRASSHTQRIAPDTMDKREKRALEQKFREMEEELKNSRSLAAENQKLKDENGALIRVISKLSK